jgi:hypothetical protein
MRSPDTSPEAAALQRDAFRRLPPPDRFALAAELSEQVRAVATAGIRRRRPSATEDDVRAELAAIVLR